MASLDLSYPDRCPDMPRFAVKKISSQMVVVGRNIDRRRRGLVKTGVNGVNGI